MRHDQMLLSRADATVLAGDIVATGAPLVVEVREDLAFVEDKWLSIGALVAAPVSSRHGADAAKGLSQGQYVWEMPDEAELAQGIESVVRVVTTRNVAPHEMRARKMRSAVTDVLQDVARRLGLVHPAFDADAVATWPYIRPTTLVFDTSAVIQGGLDFAARFLYPMARLKVPEVVGIELRNMSERFLSFRRKSPDKALGDSDGLTNHAKSQGGERALLRLELRSLVEVERSSSGADSALLSISADKIQSMVADRLIFETARDHQSRMSLGQPVLVMTADQGLARTCMAEGIAPVYFDARKTSSVLGRTLAGTMFNPLTGNLYTVPLAALLWELATAFGSCRLRAGDCWLRVQAIGSDLAWSPFHLNRDLLWVDAELPDQATVMSRSQPGDSVETTANSTETTDGLAATAAGATENDVAEEPTISRVVADASPSWTPGDRIASYSVNPERLLRLILRLDESALLSEEHAMEAIGISTSSTFAEYRKFLASGGFVDYSEDGLRVLPPARVAAEAIRTLDLVSLSETILGIQSVHEFVEAAQSLLGSGPEWESRVPMRLKTVSAYGALTELSGIGLAVEGKGYCRTPNRPGVDEFVSMALSAYEALVSDGDLVLTGLWLERLSCEHGVHPLLARDLLASAAKEERLRRFVEGSTPDRRPEFDKRTLHVLSFDAGVPTVHKSRLYDGSFLIPGRAAVRLRLAPPRP